MKILVLNAGSSSLKYKLFDMKSDEVIASGLVEGIKDGEHKDAILKVEGILEEKGIPSLSSLDGIGHRVVHGGEEFKKAVIVDEHIISVIESLIPLAPLHNSVNLQGIIESKKVAPEVKQVAVFDTAFHQSIPQVAYMYPLPYNLYEDNAIRRYGFHGTSHHYVAKEAAKIIGKDIDETNLITLHLGNGASVCAIENGKSIDTSMGFTPLEGLMMGTRCGDIDAAIVFYLSRVCGYSSSEIDVILNKQSGFYGICGQNDLRIIHQMIENGDEKAKLSHEMFCYRAKKYIGSYSAILGRVDGIVFTGGIGENDQITREKICQNLNITAPVMVIQTDEEKEIALQAKALLG